MREKPLTEFMSSKKAVKEHNEKPAEPKIAGLKGPWELPEGWRWVKLEDVVIPNNGIKRGPWGGSIKKEYFVPFGYKVYEQKNVINRTFTLGHYYIDEKKFQELKDFEVKPGDVLITAAGTLGKIAIVPNGIERGIINQALIRIRLKERIVLPTFFVYLFEHYAERNVFSEFSRGGVLKNLASTRELRKLPIPLPPLSEQKRIVAKLDEVSKRLEEAKRLAREAREEAEKLMASALHEVFSKAEEKGWEWIKFERLFIKKPQYGLTAKAHEKPKGVIYLRISDIDELGNLKTEGFRYVEVDDKTFKKYRLNKGDILIARSGSVGRMYLHRVMEKPMVFASYLIRISLDPSKILPEYMFYFGLSPEYWAQVTEIFRKVAQPNINAKEISRFKIPLPPLSEQKRIVAYLDSIHEHAQTLVKLYEERERELEQLFPVILDRAFRGEL